MEIKSTNLRLRVCNFLLNPDLKVITIKLKGIIKTTRYKGITNNFSLGGNAIKIRDKLLQNNATQKLENTILLKIKTLSFDFPFKLSIIAEKERCLPCLAVIIAPRNATQRTKCCI